MKPFCNVCGNAVVYHLDSSRNKCEKCGNGTERVPITATEIIDREIAFRELSPETRTCFIENFWSVWTK